MADWSNLYQHRRAVAERYPAGIWSVPLEKRYHTVLDRLGRRGMRVLEIGAGARALQQRLQARWGTLNT